VVLGYVQAATGVVALLSLAGLGATYGAGWRTSGLTQGSAAAILPAAILMGVAFPIALRIWTHGPTGQRGARSVGVLYAANVVGGIAGAILGAFLVLPLLASRRALIALATLYLLTGAGLLWRLGRRGGAVAMTAAFALGAAIVPDPLEAALVRRHGPDERVMWSKEGIQTSVSIHTNRTGNRLMWQHRRSRPGQRARRVLPAAGL
jgi:hypothetical protein